MMAAKGRSLNEGLQEIVRSLVQNQGTDNVGKFLQEPYDVIIVIREKQWFIFGLHILCFIAYYLPYNDAARIYIKVSQVCNKTF